MYNGYYLAQKNSPAIGKNMSRPWASSARWNKSERERQILYVLLKNKNTKLIEIESKTVAEGAGGQGNGEILAKCYKLPVKEWIISRHLMYSRMTIV